MAPHCRKTWAGCRLATCSLLSRLLMASFQHRGGNACTILAATLPNSTRVSTCLSPRTAHVGASSDFRQAEFLLQARQLHQPEAERAAGNLLSDRTIALAVAPGEMGGDSLGWRSCVLCGLKDRPSQLASLPSRRSRESGARTDDGSLGGVGRVTGSGPRPNGGHRHGRDCRLSSMRSKQAPVTQRGVAWTPATILKFLQRRLFWI